MIAQIAHEPADSAEGFAQVLAVSPVSDGETLPGIEAVHPQGAFVRRGGLYDCRRHQSAGGQCSCFQELSSVEFAEGRVVFHRLTVAKELALPQGWGRCLWVSVAQLSRWLSRYW